MHGSVHPHSHAAMAARFDGIFGGNTYDPRFNYEEAKYYARFEREVEAPTAGRDHSYTDLAGKRYFDYSIWCGTVSSRSFFVPS